ncbi:hypothetical protein [Paenibacillus luteus]|uniref:hypothetical protein n=1 Tax=Paenibacillus luteus TaxID=2545753 RepID=UPI0019D648D2|nr:hypothetical protein [Paenibacillus luteus]
MTFKKEAILKKEEQNDVIQAAMGNDGVRTFLHITHHIHITCLKLQNGYRIELRDLRFRHSCNNLPFSMDVTLYERL